MSSSELVDVQSQVRQLAEIMIAHVYMNQKSRNVLDKILHPPMARGELPALPAYSGHARHNSLTKNVEHWKVQYEIVLKEKQALQLANDRLQAEHKDLYQQYQTLKHEYDTYKSATSPTRRRSSTVTSAVIASASSSATAGAPLQIVVHSESPSKQAPQ